ncbi:phage holin family protein [Acinetobacter sp. ANC 5659]|uniref:phage holin family protein n=1 Tax=Acinetobacter TaxID=469 RepID=UPI00031D1269|nr:MULTISPECIES: phage holin family protein [Acinetobacter]MCH7317939.1 phage holin family protein [Acinetobacter higginsii]HAV5431529.1 phage holin family protein [Acinetobacter baumannii]
MIEFVFQFIALLAYLFCGIRIVCFNHNGNYNRKYAILATVLIASFLGQSVHIIFFKDPVTLWDAIFAILLAVIIYRSQGNVAKLWSKA